ncbi:hypothetical protein Patl1_23419 [Pistacia atlantica]|uniref:Uncharacterized protein n=1 Tax=Pistacia atlantica TaxID=434234 RepID=A0ACC1A194_9ROSI|nr:hypothetical protein Patl1_23419 [Pistacia atlantica]
MQQKTGLLALNHSQEFSSPDLETMPIVAKTDVAEATPPDNLLLMFLSMKIRIWSLQKPDDENDTFQKVQAFRSSFEQSPKKAKQDHDNGNTYGKAGESDVIDVEFEEFCKAIEANLSIEQMVEILEANDQTPLAQILLLSLNVSGLHAHLEQDIHRGGRSQSKYQILIKKYQMTRKWDEKLGFEEDEGSEDNHNQNSTNNIENNNANMDSCGEDCVEAVMVEKAGECLSFPRHVVGETKLEASKEGRTLKDFKYGCVGYLVYLDKFIN